MIPDEYFCDRQEETRLMVKTLTNQGNVVLTSPRRVGKTGLINHCFSRPAIMSEYVTISIDILHTTSFREFIMELGSAAFNKVAKRNERLMKQFTAMLRSLSASFGYDPVNNTPTFDIKLGQIANPEFTLDEIFAFLEASERPVIVAIDEFQQIVYYPEKNIEALLRGRIQKLQNTWFVFAGSERRMMNEMFFSDLRPFYQSATPIELEPIDINIYTDFVCRQFSHANKSIDSNVIPLVYHFWDGITLYVHRIFHDAYAETHAGETCTKMLIEEVTSSFISQNEKRLRELLSFITDQQKQLLYAIAHEGKATGITSGAFVRKHSLKSASAVQSAAKRLLEIDMITKAGQTYTVSDPLLRIWIRKRITS